MQWGWISLNAEIESDYDKYWLVPQYSEMTNRDQISLDTVFGHVKLKHPIISSPMNSVTETKMAAFMAASGGLGIIHRYMPEWEQAEQIKKVRDAGLHVGASISVNNQEKRIDMLYNAGCNVLTMDVAHGDMKQCYDLVKYIKKIYSIDIISANIVTTEAAERYYDAGIDGFRVGIGSGQSCITRITTGVAYNQLVAIEKIRERYPETPIVSDGGIRNSGDIVKCLAAGADTVFIGKLLAPTDKSPASRTVGQLADDGVTFNNTYLPWTKTYVIYSGMASEHAERERIKRTGEDASTIAHIEAPEGRTVYIPDTGETTETIINRLVGGIKHGLAYMGSENISKLREKKKWTTL